MQTILKKRLDLRKVCAKWVPHLLTKELGGFPNVVGCIDGTHIRIQAPAEDEKSYAKVICTKFS